MKTSVFPVPGNIEVMAKAIANPATAKIMTIQDAKKSPVKSMVSIRGRVTSEEMVRTVQVRGNDVLQVRNVRINDGSEEIKLALWRDQVNGCNLVTSSYMEEVSLSTTQRTKIEPCEEPSSIVNGSVVAYEKTDGGYSLLIEENERFFTHSISLGILCAGLGSEEATVERTMSLLIPLDCEVQYTRGTVETFSCRSTLTTQQK
ncbi:uncharacterized protein LOC133198365 [Saccostrea echinata]|uniref:uncharacterized protein LOC133198365 n=1 Tax=Saccostrea echinata TaxID=191078 RepID=UPI002A83EA7F|nr:uncharacterized protein LOC133198365 [Saccostrea echinata]